MMNKDEQIRVEENRTYTKNPVRGSVVNTDSSAFASRMSKLRVERMTQSRLATLETNVTEIKDMLKQLLGK